MIGSSRRLRSHHREGSTLHLAEVQPRSAILKLFLAGNQLSDW